MQTYVWTENKRVSKLWIKNSGWRIIFQEVIGHTIGGDDQSRLEAIPNAIVYAMHYSISHIIRL